MQPFDIVGYTYQADIYGPECIVGLVARDLGVEHDTAGAGFTVESALDALASAAAIDRQDERSFDSDDFPKVVFRDQLEPDDRCGECGRRLDS